MPIVPASTARTSATSSAAHAIRRSWWSKSWPARWVLRRRHFSAESSVRDRKLHIDMHAACRMVNMAPRNPDEINRELV